MSGGNTECAIAIGVEHEQNAIRAIRYLLGNVVQISFDRAEPPLQRAPDVRALLHRLADEYPERLRAAQHADVARIALHLSIVIRETGTACTVCDLGGGVGLFSAGAAALGMAAVLVDDFGDQVNLDYGEDTLTAHRKYGVRVLSTDVLTKDLGLEPSSLDAITSFDLRRFTSGEPPEDIGMLVSCIVVEDRVDHLAGWHHTLDGIQKADELLMPVALHAAPDHGFFEHVERGEQRGRAMAFVVMGHGAGPVRLERQARLVGGHRSEVAA